MQQQKKKNNSAILQISLLFLIQWLSITVIVLNALALNASKDPNQGLIMAFDTGPQDFIVLIMGATSLFAVSLLLCLYLHMFFRLLGNKQLTIYSMSQKVLSTEIVLSIIIIALWTPATAIITKHFNESSTCRGRINISTLITKISFDDHSNSKLSPSACKLVDAMIIVAFVTIGLWVFTLLVSIIALLEFCGGIFKPTIIHPYENVSKLQIASKRSSAYDPVMQYYSSPSTVVTTAIQHKEQGDIIVISKPQITSNDKNLLSPTTTVSPTTTAITNNNSAFSPLPQQKQNGQRSHHDNLQQQQQQHNNILAEKLEEPAEPAKAKLNHSYDFDFSFEPIQIDLMLPSTSELIGSKKRRNYYYS